MHKYLIEGACDGSLFGEVIEAASQEEAEEAARLILCAAWGDDPAHVESLDELGEVVEVRPYTAEDYAREAAPAMLAALRAIMRHEDALSASSAGLAVITHARAAIDAATPPKAAGL